jgi:hypothetical protein
MALEGSGIGGRGDAWQMNRERHLQQRIRHLRAWAKAVANGPPENAPDGAEWAKAAARAALAKDDELM